MLLRRVLLAVLAVLAAAPASAAASSSMESTFQDDPLLVYGTPTQQFATVERLAAMGVDRLRVSLFWRLVAPDADTTTRPAGFDARDPAAYPAGAWDRYDRIVRAAERFGVQVNLNVTAPAPRWATGDPGDRPDLKEVWTPDPLAFADFVFAAARRYSGTVPGLPRVSYWTIWNEPNQGAWLAPQWAAAGNGRFVERSPALYRGLVDAAQAALDLAGHAQDTILIGETAPKGSADRGPSRPMAPRRFLLRLFCLDDFAQALRGAAAREQGCPEGQDPSRAMREQHPGLFRISGYAHHPYEQTFSPDTPPSDPEWFTLGNIRELGRLLTRIFVRHGVTAPGTPNRFPLYLTEYGYQTKPEDPLGVSHAKQAAYLDQAEFLAARLPQVRTLAQFLLVDDRPRSAFQSGLVTVAGRDKPALRSYRTPIWVPDRTLRRGARLKVWGLTRSAPRGARVPVAIEVRRGTRGSWRRARLVRARPPRGELAASVAVAASGAVRLRWRDARGRAVTSRTVTFRVGG